MIRVLEETSHNPFRTDKVGMSYYDDFLDPEGLKYKQKAKNRTGEIVYMSPNEYFEMCEKYSKKIFGETTTADSLKRQRERDAETNEELEELMKNGTKINLCFINLADGGQEGLHRMMVAGNLYGWNTKFPVLLVTTYDDEVENRQEWIRKLRKFENSYMSKCCEDALWQNYHIEDISDTEEWMSEYCEYISECAKDKYDEDVTFDCELEYNQDIATDEEARVFVWVTSIEGHEFAQSLVQDKDFYIHSICSFKDGSNDIENVDDISKLDDTDLYSISDLINDLLSGKRR